MAGLCVCLTLTTITAARAQSSRISVAVIDADTPDSSTELAGRLTGALRATAGESGVFQLYDTVLTRKVIEETGAARVLARLPTPYVCVAHVSRAQPGWAQVMIEFVDAPFKHPVVRLGSPVLIRSDSAFYSLARLAWQRLAKLENKRIDSLRTRTR